MATKSNNDEYQLNKAELEEFKNFWEGATGEKYKKKMERTKDQLLEAAMGTPDKDYVFRSVCIANGLESILLDIKATIASTKKEEKPKDESK